MLGDNGDIWWLLIVALLSGLAGFIFYQFQKQTKALGTQLCDAQCQIKIQQWLIEQLAAQDFDVAMIALNQQEPIQISPPKRSRPIEFRIINKQSDSDTRCQFEDFAASDDYQSSIEDLLNSKQRRSETTWDLSLFQSDDNHKQMLVEQCAVVLRDDEHAPQALICFLRIVNAQVAPESNHQPSFESTKMRALVNLSRGVAHDINNIFGVISGYCEMIAIEYDNESKLQGYTNKINVGIERGQQISEQLFGFSRRQKAGQTMVDFESVVLQSILHFSKKLPKTISFDWLLAHTQLKVKMNVQLLPQVINALGQNAIDAMPQGGSLRVFSSIEVLDIDKAEQLDLTAGTYLCFSVVDNGCGIAEQDLPRVVEPYFSTREQRGMGLSLVYGFCQSCDGTIEVNSVESQGTQVNLYFPLLSE